jgi:hypothetical protein
MMRSGYDNYSGIWGNPYYEDEVPADLDRYEFVHRMFEPGPALVREDAGRTSYEKYAGESYDPAECQLDPTGWDHDHCDICNFCIDPGYTYWETPDGFCLCDACYDHYVRKVV